MDVSGDEYNDTIPEPNLFMKNFDMCKQKQQNYEHESWEEGVNAKYKAYQTLRLEKEKMLDENKEFKKFRSVFRGLKRSFERAKLPNKLTEYEIPTDTSKYNRIQRDIDIDGLFQKQMQKD